MSSYSVVVAPELEGAFRSSSWEHQRQIDSTLSRIARSMTVLPRGERHTWPRLRLGPGRQHWLHSGEQWMDYQIDSSDRSVRLLAFGVFPEQRAAVLPELGPRSEEDFWDSEGGGNHRGTEVGR
jgi:hypothetical protein